MLIEVSPEGFRRGHGAPQRVACGHGTRWWHLAWSCSRRRDFEALRYEELFYVYMGATLVLGLFLSFAGFSA